MKEETIIPTQIEEWNRLHQRYWIKKLVKITNPDYIPDPVLGLQEPEIIITKDVDKDSEYFVMRLDENGKDPNHINACRIGVQAYADAIEQFIPELAKDLRKRYPVLNHLVNDCVERQMYDDLSDDFNRLISDKLQLEAERDRLREALVWISKGQTSVSCRLIAQNSLAVLTDKEVGG